MSFNGLAIQFEGLAIQEFSRKQRIVIVDFVRFRGVQMWIVSQTNRVAENEQHPDIVKTASSITGNSMKSKITKPYRFSIAFFFGYGTGMVRSSIDRREDVIKRTVRGDLHGSEIASPIMSQPGIKHVRRQILI